MNGNLLSVGCCGISWTERLSLGIGKGAPDVALDSASLKHEREIKRKQEAWLKKHKIP